MVLIVQLYAQQTILSCPIRLLTQESQNVNTVMYLRETFTLQVKSVHTLYLLYYLNIISDAQTTGIYQSSIKI